MGEVRAVSPLQRPPHGVNQTEACLQSALFKGQVHPHHHNGGWPRRGVQPASPCCPAPAAGSVVLGLHLLVSRPRAHRVVQVGTRRRLISWLLSRQQPSPGKHTGREADHAAHSGILTRVSDLPWLHLISNTTQDLGALTLLLQVPAPQGKQSFHFFQIPLCCLRC